MARQLTAHDVNQIETEVDERHPSFVLGMWTAILRANTKTGDRKRRHLDQNLKHQRSSLSAKSAQRPMHHDKRNVNGRQNKQRDNSDSRRQQEALKKLPRMHGKSIPPLAGRNQSRVSGLGNSSRTTLGESLRNQRTLRRRQPPDPRWLPRSPATLHRNG